MKSKIGFRSGLSFDPSRSDWDGNGTRPLRWSLWYPCTANTRPETINHHPWFKASPVVVDAPLQRRSKPYEVVLLSHGSGATGSALEWLAFRLAEAGNIALAVDHHGHTGSEPYRAEGFLCLWERAADLSAIFRHTEWRDVLNGEFAEHAFVVGFSAGAYSALQLLGARVAFSQFELENPEKSPISGPREFPHLANEIEGLYGRSAIFRESWDRRRDSFRDNRIRSAVLFAPGRSVRGFDPTSLASIERPATLIAGSADEAAPFDMCAKWLQQRMKFERCEKLAGAGHYVFLPRGTSEGLSEAPELFEDASLINRAQVHDFCVEVAISQFEKDLS